MYQRIKDLRQDSELTQEKIAKMLHCSQQTYSNYERGLREIPIESLILLADIYKTSVDYLLGRTDERRPYPKKKH